MEAVLLSSTPDQSISPYKRNRNPRKVAHSFISRPSENFAPSSNINLSVHGGLIGPPPYLSSSSLSSSFAILNQQKQKTPPLLPLPISSISKPYSSLPTRNHNTTKIFATTSPTTNRKTNYSKTRGSSVDVTAKKPKSSSTTSSRKQLDSSSINGSESLVRLGPDPRDLPKKVVSGVLRSKSKKVLLMNSVVTEAGTVDNGATDHVSNGVLEEISCSIFSLAPPPSSLPLPKFSLKPKLACNVDAGATDNLRRLLRLR